MCCVPGAVGRNPAHGSAGAVRRDDQKIYDYNYQATREAIERAIGNEPKVDDVIARARTAKHPFASNAEDKRGSKQMAGTNV